MARKPRVHFPEALYHAMSRGNQGQMIFRDDEDRERYLNLLKELPYLDRDPLSDESRFTAIRRALGKG